MKRLSPWLIVVILATLVLSACAAPQATPAPQATAAPEATASQPSAAAAPTTAPAAGTPFKVCFIYNTPVGDMGWNFAADQGRKALEKNIPGVTTIYTENAPAGSDAQRVLGELSGPGLQHGHRHRLRLYGPHDPVGTQIP